MSYLAHAQALSIATCGFLQDSRGYKQGDRDSPLLARAIDPYECCIYLEVGTMLLSSRVVFQFANTITFGGLEDRERP